jgi:cbb3-type cytochrome oxidase maturation protein
MDILYLLIPLSAVLVLLILGLFGWALHHGQFDDVEREGLRILDEQGLGVDVNQTQRQGRPEQSPHSKSGQS